MVTLSQQSTQSLAKWRKLTKLKNDLLIAATFGNPKIEAELLKLIQFQSNFFLLFLIIILFIR